MFLNQHKIKYFSLLILIFIFFQLIPHTSAYIKCSNSYAQNFTAIFTCSVIPTDVIILGRENQKHPLRIIQSDFCDQLMQLVLPVIIYLSKGFCYTIIVDCRKEIEQTIPHYFHGGKYKPNLIVI
jgi:hypothetical protein